MITPQEGLLTSVHEDNRQRVFEISQRMIRQAATDLRSVAASEPDEGECFRIMLKATATCLMVQLTGTFTDPTQRKQAAEELVKGIVDGGTVMDAAITELKRRSMQ